MVNRSYIRKKLCVDRKKGTNLSCCSTEKQFRFCICLACTETEQILKFVKRWDRKTMKICNVWGEANNNNLNFEFVKIQKELFLKKMCPFL